MANRKEIKSLDLTSLTNVGIGIHAVISIVIALLAMIILLIVGGVNGFLANLIIVPFIIFGTIISTIIFLFGRGLIYNILVKKINCISFEIEEGKILGIIGKNGSGKSTMLRAIAGIFSPDKGTIDLHGRSISLLSIGVVISFPKLKAPSNIPSNILLLLIIINIMGLIPFVLLLYP